MVRRVCQMLVVAGMCLVFAGCYAGRYTGGGWIPSLVDREDGKATFGFTIDVPEDVEPNYDDNPILEVAEGQVQYNDHTAKVAFHGEVLEGGITADLRTTTYFGDGVLYYESPWAYVTGIYWPVPKGQGEAGIFHARVGSFANTTGFDDPCDSDFLIVALVGGTYDGYLNYGLLEGGNTQYHPPKE